MRLPTGSMMKKVMTRVRPMRVWLEGVVCRPSAWRRKWKTTSRRANGVMQMSSDGMRVRKVRRRTMVQGAELLPRPVMRISFSGGAGGGVDVRRALAVRGGVGAGMSGVSGVAAGAACVVGAGCSWARADVGRMVRQAIRIVARSRPGWRVMRRLPRCGGRRGRPRSWLGLPRRMVGVGRWGLWC